MWNEVIVNTKSILLIWNCIEGLIGMIWNINIECNFEIKGIVQLLCLAFKELGMPCYNNYSQMNVNKNRCDPNC